jgi:hypothetical protein
MRFFPPAWMLPAHRGNGRLAFRSAWEVFGLVLLMIFTVNAGRAEPLLLLPEVVTLPASAGAPLFVDIEGNGRCNLLVVDAAEKTLLNYRQRPDGFANSPDQIIPLPPQTAWVTVCDVEAHPGRELLFSTATGLVYSRQDAGLFESDRRPLINASQAFSNFDVPALTSLAAKFVGTNVLIPVLAAGQAVLYRRNSDYEWSPGLSMTLDARRTDWDIDLDPWRDPWMVGANPAHSLSIQLSFRAKPEKYPDTEPENEGIRKIIADLKKTSQERPPRLYRADINGDGREDLILCQISGKLDFKSDIHVFLRGADQQLPERPNQILHCRGFPIPIGSTFKASPAGDLRGDGKCELVLLDLKTGLTSANGLLETVVSHGLDWMLTIRSFHQGAFARSPDATVPLTGILPAEILTGWTCFIQGDFNGDGRPDLIFKRSDTRWNIYFSTTDGRWFDPQPGMAFDAPGHGYFEIKDLKGDGMSDIILHDSDQPKLYIFMPPSHKAKGRNP